MANLRSLAKKLRDSFDGVQDDSNELLKQTLSKARYEFNKPRVGDSGVIGKTLFNPTAQNVYQNTSYAAGKFAEGVPVFGKQVRGVSQKLSDISGGTGSITATKPATEFGRKAGAVAELIPATMVLGGLSKAPTVLGKAGSVIKTGGTSAVIGGGLNKAFGGTFTGGAKEGYKAAPVIQGISLLTNPLLAKSTSRVASQFNNPLLQQLSGRVAAGGANVLQGIPMNKALNQPAITPLSAGIDFATGLVGGKRTFDTNIDVGRKPSKVHPEDVGVLDQAMDVLQNKKAKLEGIEDTEYGKQINLLADKYLKKNEIDKIVTKTKGKDMRKYYVELGKAIQKKSREVEPDYGFADGLFRMNLSDGVKGGGAKDLENALNNTQFKSLDRETKDAVLEEAQRMLAGGLGDVGTVKTGDFGYRYSANPDWYRDFYKQTGKAPSNEEFFDIALSRVKPQKGIESADDLDALIKSWGEDVTQTKDLVSSQEVPQVAKNPLLQKQQLPQEPVIPSKLQSNSPQVDDIAKQRAREELEGLMTYNDRLIKSGTSQDVANKTSYKQYKDSMGQGGNSIESVIQKSATPLSKKVSLLDYARTPQNVLKKIGLEKESKALKTAHSAYLDELPKEIDKVTAWYKRAPSPESAVRIFKHLDGQGVQLDANEAQVAKEIREYLVGWADRLKLPKDRRITNYITHIFDEQLIKKEFDEDLAKILQDKVAGSVYDPFTLERLGALGYKENVWDALDAYVKRGVRKANMDPALEQAQKAADNLELSQYNYVKSYIDRINMRPTQIDNLLDNAIKQSPVQYRLGGRPTARLSKLARQMVYRGTLGLNVGSALRNLTQGVNTYSELGEKYTILGYTNLLKNGTKELDEVGLFRNGMVEDRSLNATKKFWEKTDKVLFSFFELAERINRGSAYYGAKAKGLSKGMTEEQARKYAVDVVEKTQFTFGKIDTPVGLQSDIAKLLTQFQSYNIKQAEFLAGKAKARDIAGLARYSIGSFVMLNTIGQLLGMDYKDLIPSFKIGASPVFTGGRDIIQSITGGEDDFGNELSGEDRIKQAGKAVVPFIPAGVQSKKTIGGALDLNRGYTQTKSGNVRTPLNQTPTNWIRGLTFGTNTLPEVQSHWDAGTKALSEKQSEEFRNAPNRQEYYDSVLKGREENKQNDNVRARVEQTGQEEMSNGKLYYMGYKTDSETGQVERVVKSLDVGELDKTGKETGLGKYVITTESGNKSLVDLSKPIKYPEKTGQPNLDKELISRYNSAISTRINNIEKVYLDGQITAEQAEKAISDLTKAKISTKKKKGVKVSGGKISPVKMKITQSNTKLPTIKVKPAPKAKITFKKPKSIKITRKAYAKNKPVKFKNTLTDSLTKIA